MKWLTFAARLGHYTAAECFVAWNLIRKTLRTGGVGRPWGLLITAWSYFLHYPHGIGLQETNQSQSTRWTLPMTSPCATKTSSAHSTSFVTHVPLLLLLKVGHAIFFTFNLPQCKLQVEHSRCPPRTQEGMRSASLMKVLKEMHDNPLLPHLPIHVWIVNSCWVSDIYAGYPAILPLTFRGQASPKER